MNHGGKMKHVQVPSNLGHGDWMCLACKATNRELAVLGELEECSCLLFSFKCNVCDFDTAEAGHQLVIGGPPKERAALMENLICPLCAGDSGHRNAMKVTEATEKEVEAWRDATLKRRR